MKWLFSAACLTASWITGSARTQYGHQLLPVSSSRENYYDEINDQFVSIKWLFLFILLSKDKTDRFNILIQKHTSIGKNNEIIYLFHR